MKIKRIVLDTNVIIAALLSNQGASYRILMLVNENSFQICLTVPLMMEYEEVALRLVQDTSLTRNDIGDILDYLSAKAHRQKIHFLWRPYLSDIDDDMVLETAVASQAKCIVTHNTRDFSGAENFGIRVLTPGSFLNIIRRRQ